MAFYLVRAKLIPARLAELERELRAGAFRDLQPFGLAVTRSLRNARLGDGPGYAVWEEEDFCRPPLHEEREAVLDRYFTDLSVERVEEGEGWERIRDLRPLFPALADPLGPAFGGS